MKTLSDDLQGILIGDHIHLEYFPELLKWYLRTGTHRMKIPVISKRYNVYMPKADDCVIDTVAPEMIVLEYRYDVGGVEGWFRVA